MAPPRSPPTLPDELAEEILLRLPLDDPASLLRASLVCKPWRAVASRPGFRRRLHALHGTPPMLGFFHNLWSSNLYGGEDGCIPCFAPTTASAFSLPGPAPERRSWCAIDCRHGRVLCRSASNHGLLVRDLFTRDERRVPAPVTIQRKMTWNAAVVCASHGCDHLGCRGDLFRVVFVHTDSKERVTSAYVYSSETGMWVEPTSVDCPGRLMEAPSVLVGNSLLCFHCAEETILEYNLATHGLAVIDPADSFEMYEYSAFLMLVMDGRLGFAVLRESCLHLWSREANHNDDAGWVQSKVINLDGLLPVQALARPGRAMLVGFAAESNVLFIDGVVGVFAIDLQSNLVRKVHEREVCYPLIPVVSFYAPG